MDLLISNHCHKCGAVDEARLSFAGPHIKQSCNRCGTYKKFISYLEIPDVKLIKLRIAYITEGDITHIEKVKKELGIFNPALKGLVEQSAYWSLYIAIKQEFDESNGGEDIL